MGIYVILDIFKPGRRHSENAEAKLTLGPFTKLIKGYEGEIKGLPEGKDDNLGNLVPVFEGRVGHGGYCDTCAYDYADWAMSFSEEHRQYRDWEVQNFEIVVR